MKVTKTLAEAIRRAEVEGRVRDSRTPGNISFPVSLALSCKLRSEPNERCHWSVRSRRFKKQAEELRFEWMIRFRAQKLPLPLRVTFTRLYDPKKCGKEMDDDNLRGAFKGIRDVMAGIIGVDDADPRVKWEYAQAIGQGVLVFIEHTTSG